MAYGHAERNLALLRQLEAETRHLLDSLDQPDPEQSAWLQEVTGRAVDILPRLEENRANRQQLPEPARALAWEHRSAIEWPWPRPWWWLDPFLRSPVRSDSWGLTLLGSWV
jgi:hypothetical protein